MTRDPPYPGQVRLGDRDAYSCAISKDENLSYRRVDKSIHS